MTNFISQYQSGKIRTNAITSKNKPVLIALGVWFALAAALFAWFGVQNHQFTSQLQQSKNNIKSIIDAAPAKVKAAHDTGDVNTVATVLSELSATVSQDVKSLPAAPSVAGLYVGADAERSKRQQLQITAQAYATDLAQLADYITYQSSLARQLQGLSLKDANGYDQTIELADAWREVVQKVQKEPKPASVKDVIATLLQKMRTAEATIREMAEFYKKSDSEGFAAKQTALAASIAEFKVIGVQISTVAVQLDAKLTASATKLGQNL